MTVKGELHFFCGKMASGKSTLARKMATESQGILLSEDHWLSELYPEEIEDFNDYILYSRRLKSLLKTHIQGLLKAGLNVILDFPGNTIRQRAWFKTVFVEEGFAHTLHYLDVSDEVCLQQLAKRSSSLPEGAAFTTPEEFRLVTSYFEAPTDKEGFSIKTHRPQLKVLRGYTEDTLPQGTLGLAVAFAAALDNEEYEVARQYLSDVTVYHAPSDILIGAEAILKAYRDNGEWAAENIDKLVYHSEVQEEERGYLITYTDVLTHKGAEHTYQCQQWLEFADDRKIARIKHRELPGQKERLQAFFEEQGIRR